MKRSANPRLGLQRITLRRLTASDLAGVVGGTGGYAVASVNCAPPGVGGLAAAQLTGECGPQHTGGLSRTHCPRP